MSVEEASDDDESVVIFTYCPTNASWEEHAGVDDHVWVWDHGIYQEPFSLYHETEIGEEGMHYMDAVQYASELAAFDIEQQSRSLMKMDALGVMWVEEGFFNVPAALPSLRELHEPVDDVCKTPDIFFESRMPYWNFGDLHAFVM